MSSMIPNPLHVPKSHSPVGKCIYCGSTEPPLTNEHIIPEGLGGSECLPAATCERCRKITANAENAIGNSLEPLLRFVGIRGKRKKAKSVRVKGIGRAGLLYSVDKDPSEVGILGIFPSISEPPRYYTGIHEKNEVNLEFNCFYNPPYVGAYGSAGTFRTVNHLQFSRMIAKMMHANAVARLGLASFSPLLTDFIREKDENGSKWIGKCPERVTPIPGNPAVSIQIYSMKPPYDGLLLGRARLFECLGGPIYDAPLGRLLVDHTQLPKPEIFE